MNEFELKQIEWEGEPWLDYFVDGQSLYHLLYPDNPQGRGASCLFLEYDDKEFQRALDGLLLRGPADFADNRRAFYVCHMCGDLACGAHSVVIEESENTMIWRDFGWENSYENHVERDLGFGPLVFDKTQYIEALENSISIRNNLLSDRNLE